MKLNIYFNKLPRNSFSLDYFERGKIVCPNQTALKKFGSCNNVAKITEIRGTIIVLSNPLYNGKIRETSDGSPVWSYTYLSILYTENIFKKL